jgi:hypothetical protein
MTLELTKQRAEYLVKELNLWEVKAEITHSTDEWATIEIDDETDPESIVSYAFNIGVTYGRNNNEG